MERPKPALQKEKIAKHRQEIMGQLLQIKNRVSVFGSFLPNLVNYLQMLCHTFKTGQVAAPFTAWRTLTNDKILLCDVWEQLLSVLPPLFNTNCLIKSSQKMNIPLFVKKCISCLRNGSSQRCHLYLGKFCLMYSVFLLPKKYGTHRLILNLKKFNESVSHYHFKMDSLSTITKLVSQNCYMASVDMKDAYYSIPIRSSDRKFLRFIWEGELYEFTCLPNGLSCAPRIFT